MAVQPKRKRTARPTGAGAFKMLRAALAEAKWPDVAPGTSYGRQALNFRGTFLVGVKDTLVIRCPLRHRIDRAWRMKAPKRLVAAYDAGRVVKI